MHTLRLPLLLFFICVMVNVSLHGMDVNDDFVMREIVVHNVGHDAHRKLAVMNRAYNKIIEERYRPDKKCIEELMLQKGTLIIPGQVSWNKDFSKCAWVTVGQKALYCRKKLELTLVGLDSNRDIIIGNGKCGGYKFPVIDDQTCPFFDKEGGIFCYGIGDIKSSFDNGYSSYYSYNNSVIEYSLSFASSIKRKRCILDVGYFAYGLDDGTIINFPVLLKAFLRSTEVYESSTAVHGIVQNFYSINGVVIPEDYKTFKKHASWDFRLLSYDDLSEMLRNAIDERYEEQQREKNSQTSQEK